MWFLEFALLVILISIGNILAQSGGTTATGTYVCVPPGYCNTDDSAIRPGIDPRIISPGELCPTGLNPCFTQGSASQCGKRFVTDTNTGDGQADAGAYPWQAYLALTNTDDTVFAGSGVLLDNYHVLTAAHKVYNVANPTALTVRMGVYNPTVTTNVQISTVVDIEIINEADMKFDNVTLKNDVAILRLATPFSLRETNVNAACLPAAGSSYVGSKCVVSGWGQTSFDKVDAPTTIMKQVNVEIVNYTTCRNSFSRPNLLSTAVDTFLDEDGEICAGGESMKDACTQDGGSPLVCLDATAGRYYVAGLVIWGKNCGQPDVYGVYVSVSSYRNWIDSTITKLNMMATTD